VFLVGNDALVIVWILKALVVDTMVKMKMKMKMKMMMMMMMTTTTMTTRWW
jgi:hypothetical protein